MFLSGRFTQVILYFECVVNSFLKVLVKCILIVNTQYLTNLYPVEIRQSEPQHEISNNVVCATSEASDQPAHTRSLIRGFAIRLNILLVLSY